MQKRETTKNGGKQRSYDSTAGRNSIKELTVEIEEARVTTMETLKYLGVWVSRNPKWAWHIKKIADKAERTASRLRRLIPSKKIHVLASVTYSIILWGEILKVKEYRTMLERIQHRLMIRIRQSYRTVSTEALQIITRSIPIDLVYERITQSTEKPRTNKKQMRAETLTEWEEG
ncbi:hypothetical protein ILUMI_11408 [Ignelater luminosus]|uniref:Uncharacterized protein n=1 Tax=Ignelater luminosus TaxID=2038154 RepID=A0A8K0G7R9_IGNLU|nr:hypothetical protein ILUMI_11408 [Ignelater luminosus]